MAEIAASLLPLRLYRYRNIERSIEALDQEVQAIRNNEIFCSDFAGMNDPMEGFFSPSEGIDGRPNYKDALARVRDKKTDIGIACFSETCEDIIMWTHYAGNHTGICLSYSSRRLVEGLPDPAKIVRVSYADQPVRITSVDLRNSAVAARKILSQKRYSWAHEREWRVLTRRGLVSIEGEMAVRDVYFGSRIKPALRHKILLLLKGTGIKAYTMEIDAYRHEWRPVKLAAEQQSEPGYTSKRTDNRS